MTTQDDIAARNYAAQMAYTGRVQKTTKKTYKKPEANIQADCLDLLHLMGFIAFRTNAGAIEIAPGQWFYGVPAGYADIHGCSPAMGLFLAIETKAPKKGLNPKQIEYRALVEQKGGVYIAPHSVDELRAGLVKAYGPQVVSDWEKLGAARERAKKEHIAALKKKMGQTK